MTKIRVRFLKIFVHFEANDRYRITLCDLCK